MKAQSTRRNLILFVALAACAACFLVGSFGPAGAATDARRGGTFRISISAGGLDHVDPALSYLPAGWALLDTVCARLMNYPDRPPPDGFRLVPEVAARPPRVSNGGRTYTFILRRGFRFSNGAPVRADAFARAINRTLAPDMRSPGSQYTQDVVGADAVQAGKSKAAAGVIARGYRLTIRLKRPIPDLPARTTMPFFCAVPPRLPAEPEGVGAFPGSGPYYIAEYIRGRRVTIKRNRFYGGKRPHHVDRFVVDLQATPDQTLDRVERGQADWASASIGVYLDPARRLAARYGVNKSRFFLRPGLFFRGFVFNHSRPLFRNNAGLRRAVNFAVDRAALRRVLGGAAAGRLTDQYLPPALPGFEDVRIYPLNRPDFAIARRLARGRTRSGKAVLYVPAVPRVIALGQIVKRNLAEVGLDVRLEQIPRSAYLRRVATPGEAWDIASFGFAADYVDPYSYVNLLLDGRFDSDTNVGRFNSPAYNRLMRRAASRRGEARYRAYGALDVQLAREAAPMLPFAFSNEATLVSKRVGCIVLRPVLDLTAACLKR